MTSQYVDITPVTADNYTTTSTETSIPVLLLNEEAYPARMVGYLRVRCIELKTMAELAACSGESEQELKQVLDLLWGGLEQVLEGLDVLGRNWARSDPSSGD